MFEEKDFRAELNILMGAPGSYALRRRRETMVASRRAGVAKDCQDKAAISTDHNQ